MVLASDDVRNFHFEVVDNIYKMEDPRTVRTSNSHVWLHAAVEFDPATHHVIDDDRFAGRAETNGSLILINDILIVKQIQVILVDGIPFTLKIGTVLAAHPRSFIPLQTEPPQSLVNYLDRLMSLPVLIGILDPQEKRSLVVAREKPIEQRRPRTSNVHEAGGRGREANPDGRTHGGINSNHNLERNLFLKTRPGANRGAGGSFSRSFIWFFSNLL